MPSSSARSLLAAAVVLVSTPSIAGPPAAPAAKCEPGVAARSVTAATAGNPKARQAAQRGVTFLARSTAQWQRSNGCYGCHVQAVTIEGLAVGRQNQYEIPADDLKTIIDGVLYSSGGARGPGGLTHGSFPRTAKTFGGAAFARYDQHMGSQLRDDLVKLAKELLAFQQQDGSVPGDHQSYPVTTGPMQATYQAMQTWRQVYARTADDAWLAPIHKAEKHIAAVAASWEGKQADQVYLQDVNYALLGMVAAGVSRSEDVAARLIQSLLGRQNQDGGWGFSAGQSDPFATGQTVYALRMAGLPEREGAVARGLQWLISHQKKDGGWGASGSGKAEAMWAVLGLVSVDVVSLAVKGLQDGQHVAGVQQIEVEARDNQGGAVERVELFVDDQPAKVECGGTLKHAWNTAGLSGGKHIVDAVATNARGQVSRRRFEVYAGDVFLTSLASRFTSEGTLVSVRNIASRDQKGAVAFKVLAAEVKDGQPRPGAEVYSLKQPGVQGAMSFTWTGKGSDGKVRPNGRYFAEVAYLDEAGKVRQTERMLFTHDTPERQRAQYGEIAGQLGLAAAGGRGSANSRVELVDAKGNVVQSVMTNEDGQYRFKSVDKGQYKVRVRKDGFKDVEADVVAAPAQESKASLAH
jgi:squalene-hopene/tetraprenyl-beta-curcumene cyclase